MNVNDYRHPKEVRYIWLCSFFFVIFGIFILPFSPSILLFSWILGRIHLVSLYAHSVLVSSSQYKEIYDLTQSLSRQLRLKRVPKVFVNHSGGILNAFAMRLSSKNYIVLNGNLIDLLWSDTSQGKLKTVIAHELAHHAAGHTSPMRNLVMNSARFIPFLRSAYRRACELTADHIAGVLVNNKQESIEALIALTSGSRRLTTSPISKEAFLDQEKNVPRFFGFLREIFSSHPRMTKRIASLDEYYLAPLYEER